MKHFKLFLASLALMGAMNANAQTDVTATYLTNADFTEGTPLTVNVHTYAKDIVGTNIAQMQSVDGWDIVANGDARAAGVFTYGDGLFVGGDSYFTPSTNPDGVAEGNALGMVAVWSASLQYTQDVTFPAGVYTLTFPVYNSKGGTSSISTNLFGFLEDGGTKHYATNKTFPVNSWSTMSVTFTLDEQTSGKISLGYVATNSGSGSMPHLFLDKVTITYTSLLEGVKELWEEARAAAQEAYENPEYSNICGEESDALYAEIAKEEPTTLEGYEEATAALQEATATFVAAKDAYDTWVNASDYPELIYADPAKKTAVDEACDPIPVSAADAQEKTAAIYQALRAYYESHALAEGYDGAVNMTESIANYDATNGNNGWTWTGSKNDPRNTESWTDSQGNNQYMYFDGGNWGATGWTTTMKQDVEIPAGRYLLTAKGRASDGVTLTMTVGEESVELPNVNASGNVFDRGWCDGSIEFETKGEPVTILVKATTQGFHQWFSISDFRLVQLEEIEIPMADDNDYATLYEVASYYKDLELGFDEGEYAPYNNVEAILLGREIAGLDEEKVLNHEYTKEYIQGLTEAVLALEVVPNETEVNAIYDGEFANTEANVTSGDINLPGWTKVEGIRLLVKDESSFPGIAYTDGKAALFSWGGTTLTYGEQTGYTLPLNEGEIYELTFKIAGWRDGDLPTYLSVTLDDEIKVIDPEVTGRINDAEGNPFKEVKFYFTASSDVDDSILKIYANKHFTIADLNLMLADKTDLVLLSTDTAAPEEQYAGTVTTDRVLLEGLNTLILPFETTKEEIGATTVLEYTGTTVEEDGLTLNFTEVESLSANVPYAVMMDADAAAPLSFEMKEVTPAEDLTVADDNFTFVGTYVDIPKGNDIVVAGDYVAGAEKFKKAKGGNRVAAYRAYLKKAEEAPEAKIAFNFDGTIVDGIEAVEILNKLSGNIYNLNGQKMEKAQKGVNIINGKKVLVK